MSSLANAVDIFQLLGETTRVRLLSLLAEQELSVAELVSITEVGQSRVSTHLGKLRDAGILRDRRVGASSFYSLNEAKMPDEAKKVWAAVSTGLADAQLDSDRARCAALLKAREKAAAWPDALAGQMERHYSPGRTWEATARAFVGLAQLGDVLDVGSGDGTIAQLLCERARSITCLDRSEKMIDAARARLTREKNVRFALGDAQQIPFPREAFDHVLLFNVLTHAEAPHRVLAEIHRVLRKGGTAVMVTLDAHAHTEVTRAYQHVHPGFAPTALRRMLHKVGFEVERCEVTSREKKSPHFQVVNAFARKN